MKFMNKFYLNKLDNRVMVGFYLCVIVLNIIAILKHISMLPDIANALGIFAFFPMAIVFGKRNNGQIFPHGKSSENEHLFAGSLNYKDIDKQGIEAYNDRLISRKNHRAGIEKQIEGIFEKYPSGLKGILITGDSGAGKSVLLKYLEVDLDKAGYDVYVNRGEYNALEIPCSNKRQVVFLDHFEKAFKYKSYITKIKEYKNADNTVFVFFFPQTYLSGVNSLLKNNFQDIVKDTYILSVDEEDEKELKRRIQKFVSDIDEAEIERKINQFKDGEKIENEKSVDFLCCKLVEVSNGKAPLVEIELLGHILSCGIGNADKIRNKHSFIDLYLDDWVSKFPNVETAYILLYLLSDGKAYSAADIKLAVFEPEGCFSDENGNSDKKRTSDEGLNIIDALQQNPLIHTYRVGDDLFFETTHNYVAEELRKYCLQYNIPNKYYIDYFRECAEGNRNEISKFKNAYEKIEDNYEVYHKSHISLSICFALMFVAVLAINIYRYFCRTDIETHIQYIANTLICAPATYYIYNYCARFLKIRRSIQSAITYICGAIVVALSYFYLNAWGIFMGAEIVVLAISIVLSICPVTYQQAKAKFRQDAIVFAFIGLTIIGLGLINFNLFTNSVFINTSNAWAQALKYSYYIEFICYAGLSVFAHIRYEYIIGKIGHANMVKWSTNKNRAELMNHPRSYSG